MSYDIKTRIPEPGPPPSPTEASFPGSLKLRRSFRQVWMILNIVALVSILGCTLLALGATWAIMTYYNSPLRVSDTYYSAIKKEDYSTTVYTYLGSHLQKVYSQEAFIYTAQQQDRVFGRVKRFGMNNIPTGNPANVTLTVTRTNGTSSTGNTNETTYTVHLSLRQEGGARKIAYFDRI